MKKFILCLSISLLAVSMAQAQYVRKVVRPNFFIPAKELNRVEKLPPFPEYEDVYEEDINYVIPAKQEQSPKAKEEQIAAKQDTNEPTPTTADEKEPVILIPFTLDNPQEVEPEVEPIVIPKPQKEAHLPNVDERVLPDMATAQIDDKFEQSPEYKQLAQKYAEDIAALAENGQIPENKNVSAALSKMISDDAVWVDENFGK